MIVITTLLIASCYLFWGAKVLRGWQNFAAQKPLPAQTNKYISIVVPFRNEAEKLPSLLQSIEHLNYSKENFELVFIDDHSSDRGKNIIEEWARINPIQTRVLTSKIEGKKAAQHQGVIVAQHSFVACTDADCELPNDWLENINSAFDDEKTKLVFGAVHFAGKGFSLQKIEFLSLIGSTMAMLQNQWPVMGNGAHMAFQKEAYLNVWPQLYSHQSPSGDDVFLLHELSKMPGAVKPIFSKTAVLTMPPPNLMNFINQRVRWASKAKKYQSNAAILVGALVLVINAFLLAMAFVNGTAFLALFVLKSAIDAILIKSFAKFYEQPFSCFHFIVQEFVNLIYIPGVALLAMFSKYTWKGRKY